MATAAHPPSVLSALPPAEQVIVRRKIRKELTAFFVTMTSASEKHNWPNISEQELAEAVADSLIDMGRQRGLGVAILQTTIHELQDRVNQNLIN